jgi:methionyl-tRNA synthetase
VSPSDLLAKYPVDAVRSYIISNFTVDSDFNFSESALVRHHDSVLLADLGNLVNRTFGLIHKYCPEENQETIVPNEKATQLFDLKTVVADMDDAMNSFKLNVYHEKVFGLVTLLNTYVNDTCIWSILNPKNPDDRRTLLNTYDLSIIVNPDVKRTEKDRHIVLKTLIEGLYIIAHFLVPIMPNTASKIAGYLGTQLNGNISELNWSAFNPGFVIPNGNTLLFEMLNKESAEARKLTNMKKKTVSDQKKQKPV